MKKLNLEKLKLAAEDVLQRSQMTGIYGGSGNCTVCYLFDIQLNLLETLVSAGPCDAQEVCDNYPDCRFQNCY